MKTRLNQVQEQKLMNSINHQKLDEARWLLQKSWNVNGSKVSISLVLMYLIRYGYYPEAEQVLKNGEKIDGVDSQGQTILMVECANNMGCEKNEKIKFLLKNGADPNKKDSAGWTSLMNVVFNKDCSCRMETARLLLEYGADINAQNGMGMTPLMLEIEYFTSIFDASSDDYTRVEYIRWMLKSGADPNLKNVCGKTALMVACFFARNQVDLDIIKLLLKNGANIDEQDNLELTALMHASGSFCNSKAESNIKEKVINLLLKYGANTKLIDKRDNDALKYANKVNPENKTKIIEILS